jgi:hypothetical protein
MVAIARRTSPPKTETEINLHARTCVSEDVRPQAIALAENNQNVRED